MFKKRVFCLKTNNTLFNRINSFSIFNKKNAIYYKILLNIIIIMIILHLIVK